MMMGEYGVENETVHLMESNYRQWWVSTRWQNVRAGGGAGRGSQGVMCRSRLSAAIGAGVLSLINMERVELRRLFLRASYASSRLTSQVP